MSRSGMSGFRPRFFVAEVQASDACGSELCLCAEDSYHALRVLRLNEGDECEVVVGAAVYAATVTGTANPVRVRLTARLEGEDSGAAYQVQVGVVQALARPAAMDYVLEKGTEVGSSFFLLVRTAGSPRRAEPLSVERMARWRRIAREAAKQSKQLAVPPVEVVDSLDSALCRLSETETLSLVLEPTTSTGLQDILARRAARPARVALWVGPEGGWTVEESDWFIARGMEPARLGRSILRTETVGPVAVAIARLALGDW